MTSLGSLLADFAQFAWRLETQDTYDVSDEREQFEQFMAGQEPLPSEEDLEWQAGLRSIAASGRSIGRVRLVGQPITPYTRFEFAYFPETFRAGEDIRVVDRSRLSNPSDPRWDQDFWLFDDQVAAVMHYDDGQFTGITVADDPAPYIAIRREMLAIAVPFDQYTLLPSPRGEDQHGSAAPTSKENRQVAH